MQNFVLGPFLSYLLILEQTGIFWPARCAFCHSAKPHSFGSESWKQARDMGQSTSFFPKERCSRSPPVQSPHNKCRMLPYSRPSSSESSLLMRELPVFPIPAWRRCHDGLETFCMQSRCRATERQLCPFTSRSQHFIDHLETWQGQTWPWAEYRVGVGERAHPLQQNGFGRVSEIA